MSSDSEDAPYRYRAGATPFFVALVKAQVVVPCVGLLFKRKSPLPTTGPITLSPELCRPSATWNQTSGAKSKLWPTRIYWDGRPEVRSAS